MASIKLQFEPLVQEKNAVDVQNQGYLAEITEIRKKISNFTEIRNQLRVNVFFSFGGECPLNDFFFAPSFLMQQEIDKITEKRLKAQGALQHYEKKLKENHEAIEQESHIAELLEQEFKVNRTRFVAFSFCFEKVFLHFFL